MTSRVQIMPKLRLLADETFRFGYVTLDWEAIFTNLLEIAEASFIHL